MNMMKLNRKIKKLIVALPRYLKYKKHRELFIAMGGKVTHKYAIFSDWDGDAGTASGHYFHQDLLVASFIYQNNPVRHVDIGSRIDGFVAHVASFRSLDVMDVRFVESTGHKNINFIKADLMDEKNAQEGIADSISSLHAIEHFGLGRYGDAVDPAGHIKGFRNMLRMLKTGGNLYISFPIGKQNEVHFNAHRVFHPRDILSWMEGENIFKINRFDFVDDDGKLHLNKDLYDKLDLTYGCGIYSITKN